MKKMKEYQINQLRDIWGGERALINWEPGTGKTLLAISLLIAKIHVHKQVGLVIAPKSICSQWIEEISNWIKLGKLQEVYYKLLQPSQNVETVELILEKCKAKGAILICAPSIFNSEISTRCLIPFIDDSNISTLVLDEGHKFLNNDKTQISNSINSLKIINRIVLVCFK